MIIKPRPESGKPERRADGFSGYVFRQGRRTIEPLLLFGNREVFDAVGVARASSSTRPVATFDVGFEEQVGALKAKEIFWRINDYITVELDPADVVALAGYHEKPHDKTQEPAGRASCISSDGHLGYIKMLLRSGVQWTPLVQKNDAHGLAALQEIINYEFGLSSPKDPSNWRKLTFPDKDPNCPAGWKDEVMEAVQSRHQKTPFTSQADFVAFLRKLPKVADVLPKEHLVHVVVSETSVCMKGTLATRWHYENPAKYARLPAAEYERIFNDAVDRRRKRHVILQKRKAQVRQLPWLNLLGPVDIPDLEMTNDQGEPASKTLAAPTPPIDAAPGAIPAPAVAVGIDYPNSERTNAVSKVARKPSLQRDLEELGAILMIPNIDNVFAIEEEAEQKGVPIRVWLNVSATGLAVKTTAAASATTLELRGFLEEFRMIVEAWNAARTEKDEKFARRKRQNSERQR